MKKKRKNKRLIYTTVITTLLLILIGILLISGLVKLISSFKPFYKVEERAERVEEYASESQDTTVGWIRVQGTNIDYPVIYPASQLEIQTKLDDFAWTVNNVEDITNYVYILGHNIRNVSSNPLITDENNTRFEQLPSFMYLDFIKENKYIQYTIAGEDYLYKIFSVSIVKSDRLMRNTYNYSKEKLKTYIDNSLEDSFYDFDIEVDENDKIITLATCTRFYGSTTAYTYKIDARMLRKDEKARNYSVKENENYKAIKEIMEGGETHEEEI